MTTIAYRDGIMAADTQVTMEEITSYGHKLHMIGKECIAVAGNCDSEVYFLEWYSAGQKKEDWPVEKMKFEAMVVDQWGDVFYYNKTRARMSITHPFWSIGVGSKLAQGFMFQGMTALQAVRAVGEIEINTNEVVDWYSRSTGKITLGRRSVKKAA